VVLVRVEHPHHPTGGPITSGLGTSRELQTRRIRIKVKSASNFGQNFLFDTSFGEDERSIMALVLNCFAKMAVRREGNTSTCLHNYRVKSTHLLEESSVSESF
jgi:hypothetical protein